MHSILINGLWTDPATDEALEIVEPATLDPLGRIPACGARDVERAVAAARAALPGWSAVPLPARVALLAGIGARTRTSAGAIATLLSAESGRPLQESLDCLEAVAAAFEAPVPDVRPEAPGRGVVVLLPPPDLPMLAMARALHERLCAGDTIVGCPPLEASLAVLAWAALFDGLPSGVCNIITGGAATAALLANHADVAACASDTHDATGIPWRAITVGGSAPGPFVVAADAPLEPSVAAVAWACLQQCGQLRSTTRHLYVERGIAGDYITQLHGHVGLLEVGNPRQAVTDVGPLATLSAARSVEAAVMGALRERATPLMGGRRFRPSGYAGHFFQPTLLCDVAAQGPSAQARIRGPVILITTVDSVAEGLAHAAAIAPGAGASLHCADGAAAGRYADTVAGTLLVNDPSGSEGPFAARPAAGGTAGPRIAGRLEPKPWWFPYAGRAGRTLA